MARKRRSSFKTTMHILLPCLTFTLLVGCTSNYGKATNDLKAIILVNLRNKEIKLDCGKKCLLMWISQIPLANRDYLARQWADLAAIVYRASYGDDLAYYYLGQAAEGLGYRDAALFYYDHALMLAAGKDTLARCEDRKGDKPCEGIDIAHSVQVLIGAATSRPSSSEESEEIWVGKAPDRRQRYSSPAPVDVISGAELSATGELIGLNPKTKDFQPWPPPRASGRLLFNKLEIRKFHTLGALADYITAAFRNGGYDDFAYFSAPGGFAIVTKLEQFDGDGEPLDIAHRWVTEISQATPFSIRYAIAHLLDRPLGHYRFFVTIITTDVESTRSDKVVTPQVAQDWSSGPPALNPKIENSPISSRAIGYINVYEFQKDGEDGATLLLSCTLPPRVQFDKAHVKLPFLP